MHLFVQIFNKGSTNLACFMFFHFPFKSVSYNCMQFKVIFTILIWLEIKVKYPHALLVITGYFRAFTPTTVATKKKITTKSAKSA